MRDIKIIYFHKIYAKRLTLKFKDKDVINQIKNYLDNTKPKKRKSTITKTKKQSIYILRKMQQNECLRIAK